MITRRMLLVLVALAVVWPASVRARPQSTITVSGTITDSGDQPLSGIQVTVTWGPAGETQTTGAGGTYHFSAVPAGGEVQIFVRAPVERRLAQRNWWIDPAVGDIAKDFQLVDGYLLSGRLAMPDGTPPPHRVHINARPATFALPGDEWLGQGTDQADGSFAMVLPPDAYTFRFENLPAGTYAPQEPLDLSGADVTDFVLALSAEPVAHIRTYPPPNASLIHIGTADDYGVATISGEAGAVPGLYTVILANLDTGLYTTTLAAGDGSFSARLFAPPGAHTVVKYTRDQGHVAQLNYAAQPGVDSDINAIGALPGTILRTPLPSHLRARATGEARPSDALAEIPFGAAASAVGPPFKSDARWWVSGTLSTPDGLHVQPGDTIEVVGTLRVASQAMGAGYDPTGIVVPCGLALVPLFDEDGDQLESLEPGLEDHVFMATLLTPTGLPIERDSADQAPVLTWADVDDLQTVTRGVVEGTLSLSVNVPAATAAGVYAPRIVCHAPGLPTDPAPMSRIWGLDRATNEAYLPILRVGQAEDPQVVTTLLANTYAGGARGARAGEDSDQFQLSTMVAYQPQRFVAPRVHPVSGQPIAYRLEPFLPMMSFTDRAFASVPLVPFDLPSGELEILVEKPDGSTERLGPAPLAQSYSFQPTTLAGGDFHLGAPFVADIYSLTTLDDAFRYAFDQYGHHVITMAGTVDDVWGHSYTIGGTYDVWIARELDLDPGQLPTTPYEVGDAFSPALQVIPRVPAHVEMALTLLPDSDPVRAITHTIRGQANRFGAFHPGPGASTITLTGAGEFRVDVHATYTDTDGTLWAGSLRWGDVVETPGTPLVAHGRHGIDNAPEIGQQWFLWENLSEEERKDHIYYPFQHGDVVWGKEDDIPGGEALIPAVTIQDTVGAIEGIIEARHALPHSALSQGPGTFEERVTASEIPLFSTASSGVYPDRYPEQIDQWGYSYRSSERPGVRVRELVSEDSNLLGYWRFDDMYGRQIGMGHRGDLPNDYKFQFGGVVFRDLTQDIHEYAIYSAMWVLLPNDDPTGSRVMPPYQGMGGGSQDGGPLMVLKGEEIDVFFLPLGVRPGSVLEVGDAFSFSGHVAPPLDSRVTVTVTSPSDAVRTIDGHADKVGWFYDPSA
ncbi:MAG: carboxypeptidase-like regulatory domain-containing protein, partial [Anaerolineae bacterium]